MNKSILSASLFVATLFASGALFAADTTQVTVTGEGKCAKCAMHEGANCQTAIEATENGQSTVYYLAENEVAKKFHSNVCHGPAKVTATGSVELKDGKHVLSATSIALAK